MKRRVISKPFFQGSYLAFFLSLFRTEFICVMAKCRLSESKSSLLEICRTEGIWRKQIASCVFCCTESVMLQKTLAPQGGKTPSEVGCFCESFRAMIEWQSDTARRILPLKNPTYE